MSVLPLRAVALGIAYCDADHRVREEGGNNRGPRIRQYLENIDPPVGADVPWCAAAVQYWSDAAARALGVPNPLDVIRQEALVQDYYDHLRADTVGREDVEPGDLVLYRFPEGPDRWNHIGLVAQPPKPGSKTFWAVEGNTGTESERDGDGVVLKPRELDKGYPVAFITWADGRRFE